MPSQPVSSHYLHISGYGASLAGGDPLLLPRSDTMEDVKLSSPEDSPEKTAAPPPVQESLALPRDMEINLNDESDDEDLFKSARGPAPAASLEPEPEKGLESRPPAGLVSEISLDDEEQEENPFKVRPPGPQEQYGASYVLWYILIWWREIVWLFSACHKNVSIFF